MPIKRRVEEPVRSNVPAQRHTTEVSVYKPAPELIPGYGNISHEDLVVPRIKLLQGMSPETKPDGGSHPQGLFFHTSEGETIGDELTIISLGEKKTVEVWPPRGSREEGEGILARSSDGVNWDEGFANRDIIINYNDGRRETWRTKANVKQSGFTEFRDGRAPISGFTYRVALYLIDYPQYPATLYIVSRTATQGLLDLHGRINNRARGGTPFWQQQYLMKSKIKKGGKGIEWFVPVFENLPPLTEAKHRDLIAELKERAAAIYASNVVSHDEEERLAGKADRETRSRQRESQY